MAKTLPAQRANLARLRVCRAIAFVARHWDPHGQMLQSDKLNDVLMDKVLTAPTLTAAFELLSDEQKLTLRGHLENPSVDVIDYKSKNSWSKDSLTVLALLEAGEFLPLGDAPPGPSQGTKIRRSRNNPS